MKKKKNSQPTNSLYSEIFFLFFIILLPTQLGKHFFPPYSYLNGVRVDYLSPTVYLTDIFVLLLLIFNFKRIFEFFKNKRIIVGLALFVINVFMAKNKIIAFYQFLKILELLVVFSVSRELIKTVKEKTILLGFFLMGFFQLSLSLCQLVLRHSVQGIFYFFGERLFNLSTPGIAKATLYGVEILRPYGTFSHPNSLAGFFLLLYFFTLTYKNFKKHFFLKYFNLLIFSILIFISFSKVAIISFLLLNTFYYILNSKIKCLFCKIARIFIPITVSIIFLQATTDPLTFEKRIDLVKNSFSILKQNLFFGTGIGNYLVVQSEFSSKYVFFFNQPVHNIFLLFLSEIGMIIGGFLLLECFKALKFLKINKEFYFVILPIILTGFFDHYWLTLQQNWLLLGLVYGIVSSSFFILKFKSRS